MPSATAHVPLRKEAQGTSREAARSHVEAPSNGRGQTKDSTDGSNQDFSTGTMMEAVWASSQQTLENDLNGPLNARFDLNVLHPCDDLRSEVVHDFKNVRSSPFASDPFFGTNDDENLMRVVNPRDIHAFGGQQHASFSQSGVFQTSASSAPDGLEEDDPNNFDLIDFVTNDSMILRHPEFENIIGDPYLFDVVETNELIDYKKIIVENSGITAEQEDIPEDVKPAIAGPDEAATETLQSNLESSPMVLSNSPVTATKKRGRPKTPYRQLPCKNPRRGRPSSASKSESLSDSEKYRRMRDLNNEASRRCREKRRQKVEGTSLELDHELQRKETLTSRVLALEKEVNFYKKAVEKMYLTK